MPGTGGYNVPDNARIETDIRYRGAGTAQKPWELLTTTPITNSGAQTAFGALALASTLPAQNLTTGRIVRTGLDPSTFVNFAAIIGGTNNQTMFLRGWGIQPIGAPYGRCFKFAPLFDITLIAGANQVPTDGGVQAFPIPRAVGATTMLFVDSFTTNFDGTPTPGIEAISDAADGWAEIKVDFFGCAGYVLEATTSGGTATNCLLFARQM